MVFCLFALFLFVPLHFILQASKHRCGRDVPIPVSFLVYCMVQSYKLFFRYPFGSIVEVLG